VGVLGFILISLPPCGNKFSAIHSAARVRHARVQLTRAVARAAGLRKRGSTVPARAIHLRDGHVHFRLHFDLP
jgi:hypothetical protein